MFKSSTVLVEDCIFELSLLRVLLTVHSVNIIVQ